MEHCTACGVETQLHVNGRPLCPKCCEAFETERKTPNSGLTRPPKTEKREIPTNRSASP